MGEREVLWKKMNTLVSLGRPPSSILGRESGIWNQLEVSSLPQKVVPQPLRDTSSILSGYSGCTMFPCTHTMVLGVMVLMAELEVESFICLILAFSPGREKGNPIIRRFPPPGVGGRRWREAGRSGGERRIRTLS